MHIEIGTRFKKQYKKLPAKVQLQFKKRLALFVENKRHPLLSVHRLAGTYRDSYSFNVTADVRVIFECPDTKTLLLIAIETHSELYS